MCGSCLYIWDHNLLLGIMQISCLMLSHHLKRNHQAHLGRKQNCDKYLSKQLFISSSVSLNGHNSRFQISIKAEVCHCMCIIEILADILLLKIR
jgi:hypothetical protein